MAFFHSTDKVKNGEKTKAMSSSEAAKGMLLTLMSAIFVAFSGEFTALASKDGIPRFQIFFIMRSIELLIIFLILPIRRPRLTGGNCHNNIMLFLFVIIGNVANIFNYLSFTYAVPGIAFGIIQGSMPFFVACIGFLFLKESLFLVDCCGILISVTGVVLVSAGMTQIEGMSTKLLVLSIVIPLVSSSLLAPDTVIMRYLTSTLGVSKFTAMLYFDLFGTVVLLAITCGAETPVWTMSLRTSLFLVGLGICKSLGTFLLFAALKVIKAYISTAVRMVIIPLALLMDYFLLQEVPNSLQAAGVVLVMLGIVLVGVYTWWTHRQEELKREILETLCFDPDER